MQRLLYYKRLFCDLCGDDVKTQYTFDLPYSFEYPGYNDKVYCKNFCLCEECLMKLSNELLDKIRAVHDEIEQKVADKCSKLDDMIFQTSTSIPVNKVNNE